MIKNYFINLVNKYKKSPPKTKEEEFQMATFQALDELNTNIKGLCKKIDDLIKKN